MTTPVQFGGQRAIAVNEARGEAPSRVLIVGDQSLLRWALCRVCSDAGDLEPVGEAASVAEALAQVAATRPRVVTLDCSSTGDSGWLLARALRDRYADLGIVILTADGSDDLLFRALDTGASAYVTTTAPVGELLAAIRHAAVAAASFSAAGLAAALRRRTSTTATVPGEVQRLSRREREVLDLLRDGCSIPEVATALYVSASTAKTYVTRIYDKLGAGNRAQALMRAVELGIFDSARTTAAVG